MATPDITVWTRGIIVTLAVRNRLDGGIPAKKEMIVPWIMGQNKAMSKEEAETIASATILDIPDVADEAAKAMYTVFKQDENGPFYEGRCFKSALKEASNVLKDIIIKAAEKGAEPDPKTGKVKKSGRAESFTALKSKCAEKVFVEDDKIYLMKEDAEGNLVNITRTPDLHSCDMKVEERPIHVQTPQGPRSALKRVDYAPAGTLLQIHLRVLNDGQFDEKLIRYLFEYMGEGGIGSNRSQGSGQFDVVSLIWPEKVKAEKTEKATAKA